MEIEYYIKNIYGVDRIYIRDRTTRDYIIQITRQTTISLATMAALTGLTSGWITFKQIIAPQ